MHLRSFTLVAFAAMALAVSSAGCSGCSDDTPMSADLGGQTNSDGAMPDAGGEDQGALDGATGDDQGTVVDGGSGDSGTSDSGLTDDQGTGGDDQGTGGDDQGTGGDDQGTTDAGPQFGCQGTPTACTARTFEACEVGDGCAAVTTCDGTPLLCGAITTNEEDCDAQQGCRWNNEGVCVGNPAECSLFENAGTNACNGQAGCNFNARCTGTATDCASLDMSSCADQPGCSYGEL